MFPYIDAIFMIQILHGTVDKFITIHNSHHNMFDLLCSSIFDSISLERDNLTIPNKLQKVINFKIF